MKFTHALLTALIITIVVEAYSISLLGDRLNATGAGLLFLSLSPVVLAVFTTLGYFLPLTIGGKIAWLRLLLFVAVSIFAVCRVMKYLINDY